MRLEAWRRSPRPARHGKVSLEYELDITFRLDGGSQDDLGADSRDLSTTNPAFATCTAGEVGNRMNSPLRTVSEGLDTRRQAHSASTLRAQPLSWRGRGQTGKRPQEAPLKGPRRPK